jgi:hypothetical protein
LQVLSVDFFSCLDFSKVLAWQIQGLYEIGGGHSHPSTPDIIVTTSPFPTVSDDGTSRGATGAAASEYIAILCQAI